MRRATRFREERTRVHELETHARNFPTKGARVVLLPKCRGLVKDLRVQVKKIRCLFNFPAVLSRPNRLSRGSRLGYSSRSPSNRSLECRVNYDRAVPLYAHLYFYEHDSRNMWNLKRKSFYLLKIITDTLLSTRDVSLFITPYQEVQVVYILQLSQNLFHPIPLKI